MINFSDLNFPTVDRTFLKGIFWILVFLFLSTLFVSARGIYNKFLRSPEVRAQTVPIGRDIALDTSVFIQRAIVIENRGNSDARNVFISLSIPNGNINRLEVDAPDKYVMVNVNGKSRQAIEMPRLSPGAEVKILLWGDYFSQVIQPRYEEIVRTSVSFDGGVAEEREERTALEEIRNLGDLLQSGLTAIYEQFNQEINTKRIETLIVSTLPALGVYDISQIENSESFSAALIAIAMLGFGAWLFFRREWAGLTIAILIGFTLWLFTNFTMNIIWLAIAAIIMSLEFRITRSRKEAAVLFVCLLSIFGVLVANTSLDYWYCTNPFSYDLHEVMNCVPRKVPGGIAVGYLVIGLYLSITEL